MRRIPAYCVHKGRNLAYITVDGREHYLGRAHSPESHACYREALSALAAGLQPASHPAGLDVCFPGPLRAVRDSAPKKREPIRGLRHQRDRLG